MSRRPSLRKIAATYFEQAKQILTRDGFHSHIAIIISDRGVVPMPLTAKVNDDTQKVFADVATRANALGARTVVLITEAWMAGYDATHPDRTASESPTKSESLFLSAINDAGEEFYISAPFKKSNGVVTIGATIERESSSVASPVLEPLRQMWALKTRLN